MQVRVQILRRNGVPITRRELLSCPVRVGLLSVKEARDPMQSRPVLQARLLDRTSGIEVDVLPQPNDARLLYVEDGKMRLIGTERNDQAEYAQMWAVEQDKC